MASPRRIERINQLIREEVTRIIDREIEFSHDAMVTVTHVEASHDALHANVYFSVLGASPRETLALLEKEVYDIQQMLNRRLRMRPVPKIRFAPDEDEMKRERVERSLAEAKREKKL